MAELTRSEVKKIARDEVMEILVNLGTDVDNPTAVQQDKAFTRNQRLASEQITRGAKITMVGVFISGIFSLLLVGLKSFFGVID